MLNTHYRKSLIGRLGLRSAHGLLNYQPVVSARAVIEMAKSGAISPENIAPFVHEKYRGAVFERASGSLPIDVLMGLSARDASTLKGAGFTTLADLAGLPDALSDLLDNAFPANGFSELPSAPAELLPEMSGGGHITKRFTSWAITRDFRNLRLYINASCLPEDFITKTGGGALPGSLAALLITSPKLPCPVFRVGYMAGFNQSWYALGTALGEVVHTLSLAPGESRNVAVIDWVRRSKAARDEATKAGEKLVNKEQHLRALDEVAQAVAQEQQFGRTSTMAGSFVTAGSFVMAGAAVGGIAGALIGTAAEPGAGTAIGAAVGAGAGVAAGSLLFSGATALGVIEAESEGSRDIIGETSQRIQQSTGQQSSFVRSLRSAVVVTDQQAEKQELRSSNVTNYNHMHALNITYYEVLQRYMAHTDIADIRPILLLPFAPFTFDDTIVDHYWTSLRVSLSKKMMEWGDTLYLAPEPKEPEPVPVPEIPDAPEPSLDELELGISNLTLTLTFPVTLEDLITGTDGITTSWLTDFFQVLDIFVETGAGRTYRLEEDNQLPDMVNNIVMTGRKIVISFKKPSNPIPGDIRGFKVRFFKPETPTEAMAEFMAELTGLDVGKKIEAEIEIDHLEVHGASFINTHSGIHLEMTRLERISGVFSGTLPFDSVIDLRSDWETYHTTIAEITEIEELNAAAQNNYETLMSTREDWRGQLKNHFNRYRYMFTRQIFSLAAGPAITRLLDTIEIGLEGQDAPYLPLHEIADTRPVGFTDGAIVLWLKRDFRKNDHIKRTVDMLLSGKPKNTRLTSLDELVAFHATIEKQFQNAKKNPGKPALFYLPSTGVFAESILGRANGAEYVDPERYWNWQDSPIPHQAAEIDPLKFQTLYRQQDNLGATVKEPHLDMVEAPSFPASTGLQNILSAVRDGGMFRDMSKSSELVSSMTSLNQLAGKMGEASAKLTGEAAQEALRASVKIGEVAANLAQQLAKTSKSQVAASPGNPTEKAASTKSVTDAIEKAAKAGKSGCDKSVQATGDGQGIPVNCYNNPGNGADAATDKSPGGEPKDSSVNGIGDNGDDSDETDPPGNTETPPSITPPATEETPAPDDLIPMGDEPVFTPGEISAQGKRSIAKIQDEINKNGDEYDPDVIKKEGREWFYRGVLPRIEKAIDDPGIKTNNAGMEMLKWFETISQFPDDENDTNNRLSFAKSRLTVAYDGNLNNTNEKLKNSSTIIQDLEAISQDLSEAEKLGLDHKFRLGDLNISIHIDPIEFSQESAYPGNKIDCSIKAALRRYDGTMEYDHQFDVVLSALDIIDGPEIHGQTAGDGKWVKEIEIAPFIGKPDPWHVGNLHDFDFNVKVNLTNGGIVMDSQNETLRGGIVISALGGWNTGNDEMVYDPNPSAANGKAVILDYQLLRGRHYKAGSRVSFEVIGPGNLNLTEAVSNSDGTVSVEYTPPTGGNGDDAASVVVTWTEDGMETSLESTVFLSD